MEISQEYLQRKFDYNPETNHFIYKYDAKRRSDWNDKFAGQEVKPVLSGGKQYVFVCDALYSYSQLIHIWEGEKRKLIKKTASELASEHSDLLTKMVTLPEKELKQITKGLIKGEIEISDIATKVKRAANMKHLKKAQVTTRKNKLGAINVSPAKTVSDYFDVNDVMALESTGLPSNIYLHPDTHKYYVKVSYKGVSHRRAGFNTLEEAFATRNNIYIQLKEAELKGVDMATFKVDIKKKQKQPPLKQTKFDSKSINPKTNLPYHIYKRGDTGKYKILITHNNQDYQRGANTYEEALRTRNELYEVLNNGKPANNTRD